MRLAALLPLAAVLATAAADLSTKKALNLAVVKQMVATVEAEAQKRNVKVTVAIVDEAGTLLFLQKMDGAGLNTVEFAQRKARHSALYRAPSRVMADALKAGNTGVLAFPNAFPNQGGLPIKVGNDTIGGIGVSGAPSEVDEAIGAAAIEAAIPKP